MGDGEINGPASPGEIPEPAVSCPLGKGRTAVRSLDRETITRPCCRHAWIYEADAQPARREGSLETTGRACVELHDGATTQARIPLFGRRRVWDVVGFNAQNEGGRWNEQRTSSGRDTQGCVRSDLGRQTR